MASVLVLVILCSIFFGQIIIPGPWHHQSLMTSDLSNQIYPYNVYTAQRLAAGQFPLWDSTIFGGQPHFADPQTAVLYPVGLFINLVAGHYHLTYVALEWRIFIDLLLGAVFTLALGARLSHSLVGGLVAAVTFTFGGFLASYPLLQLPILEAAVWLPAVLLCIELALEQPDPLTSGGWWLAASGCAAILIYAGHEQTTLYAFIIATTFLTARSVQLQRPFSPTFIRALGSALIALALSAPQWLATLTYLPATNRISIPYSQAASGYQWPDLWQILLPGGYFVRAMYVGIPSLTLALIALRQRERWWWFTLALGGMLLALGGHGPLYPILYHVKPFALFQDQERASLIVSFTLSILAGYGAADLLVYLRAAAESSRGKHLIGSTVVASALLLDGVAAIGLRQTAPPSQAFAFTPPVWEAIALCSLQVVSAVVIGLGYFKQLLHRHHVVTLAIAGPALILLGANGALGRTSSPVAAPVASEAVSFLHKQPGLFRVDELRPGELPANFGPLTGLSLLEGNDPLYIERAATLARFQNRYRVWQLFNVGYVITKQNPGTGFQQVTQGRQYHVFRMEYPLPRVYAVRDLIVATSATQQLIATEHLEQPGATAVVNHQPALSINGPALPRNQAFHWLVSDPEHLVVRISLTDNALVVFSIPRAPGWTATVDGHKAQLFTADYAFMGLPLSAGTHIVTLRYWPPLLHVALVTAGIATLIATTVWILLLWKRVYGV
ncbi:MAG: YfhO family protein [Chloroflexi bacterium]|nr:YfhO family protein [Chloroflexota bacterium]